MGSEAKKVLDMAETIDGYRSACLHSPMNALARRGEHYTPSFLSPELAQRLRTEVFRIEMLNGADIVVLHSSADNGYPHTRPKSVVCMPESSVNVPIPDLAETLRHESIHLHQRRFPDVWKSVCRREGWTPVEQIPTRFKEKCRLNPDTFYDTPFWAWETFHVPLPMFKEGKNLGDVRIEWMDIRTNALFHDPPASFVTRYGDAPQPEHPYELLAVELAKKNITTYSGTYKALLD
jgi:hypothetical protein